MRAMTAGWLASALRARLVALTLVATLFAIAVHALAMPRGLLSGDEGMKLAQIQGLAASGLLSAALFDRGARYAPDRRGNPFTTMSGFAYVEPVTHEIYGTYPLLYPLLAVPFYWLGGWFAVAGLSLLGTALALLATARLARRCLASEPAVAAVVAISCLTSPMLFYSSLVYEHTVGAAALLGAIVLVIGDERGPRYMAGAGALCALATCFRTELYAFAPAMALVLLWAVGVRGRAWRSWLAFGAGAFAVLALFLVLHRMMTPFWHPTLAVSQSAALLTLRMRFVHVMPEQFFVHGMWMAGVTLAAAAIAWGIMRPAATRPRLARIAVAVITVLVTAGWAIVATRAVASVDDVRTLTGLLAGTPLVALALVRTPEPRARRSPTTVLVAAALLFLATVVLLPKRASGGGLELGARYMIPVVPLLVIGAIDHARRHWIHAVCALLLIAVGARATVVNLRAERTLRGMGADVIAAIDQADADAMVTDVWWVGQLAVPAQDHAVVLYVGGGSTTIYDRWYDAGARRVVALRGPAPPPAGRIQLHQADPIAITDPAISPIVFELYDPLAR